jgi:hypothetical protein
MDFDNDTLNSIARYNYMHDNYNSGFLLFGNSAGGHGWNNNEISYNLSVNNCKSGMQGFGEISVACSGGNPTVRVVYNTTYNDRVYHGAPYQTLDQGSVGISAGGSGAPVNGQIEHNTQVMSADAHSNWTPIMARTYSGDYTPSVSIANNQWILRGASASILFFWGQTMYQDWAVADDVTLKRWEAGAGKGPNTISTVVPNVFKTYALALTAAERTVATAALQNITTIPGIDIVGTRATALRTRLLNGDSPVTLPEYIALGFALTRAETAEAKAIITRTKVIMLAS